MAIVENVGDLPATRALTRVDYEAPTENKFGTRSMTATDINKDGDLDLVLGSGNGVMVYLGSEGMSFELSSETLPGTGFPASSVASGDFDGDGNDDIVVSCMVLSCIADRLSP